MCPPKYSGCAAPGAGWPLKTCIFRGFGAQKTISSYSFDRIVLIFGYIVERTNTKIFSSHFLQFPSWRHFRFCKSCRRAMRIAPPAVNHRSVAASFSVFLLPAPLPRSRVWFHPLSLQCCLYCHTLAVNVWPVTVRALMIDAPVCCTKCHRAYVLVIMAAQ